MESQTLLTKIIEIFVSIVNNLAYICHKESRREISDFPVKRGVQAMDTCFMGLDPNHMSLVLCTITG